MKKRLILLALTGFSALALADKDIDQQHSETLTAIYDNIILDNADKAVAACQVMSDQLNRSAAGKRTQAIDDAFTQLITRWAAVQTTYIAGDFDPAAIDYPQYYVDAFHFGKGDFKQKMIRIINDSGDPQKALYSNQSKTLGALQAVLYESDTLNPRKLALANVIIAHICLGLDKIHATYQNHRDDFIHRPDKALALLANALASETYKTKEWRIGDPAGLSKKYAERPDPNRAQYGLSGLSLSAIDAVFTTQEQLIGEQPYPNFRELAAFYGATDQLNISQRLLDQVRHQLAALNTREFNFNREAVKPLYNTINDLQESYYSNLIQALPVIATILEADSD